MMNIYNQYSYTVLIIDIVYPFCRIVKRLVTELKKLKRKYNSTRRQAQARETRKQIIEAAYQLFAAHGYVGATIEAIAQDAGVAPETIFAIFGNKRTILAELIHISVGGDDLPVSLMQRPGPQTVLQERNPVQQMQLFAQDMSGILERVTPVFEIMRMAAKTEPEIAELLKNLLADRLHNISIFVQHLSAHSTLLEGMDDVQAAEIVWTITSPEVFGLLTADRGWSRDRYTQWLGETLTRLLLP